MPPMSAKAAKGKAPSKAAERPSAPSSKAADRRSAASSKSKESRSSYARAAEVAGAWLEEEMAAPPPPLMPAAAVTTIDLSHQHLTKSSLQLLPPTLTCVDVVLRSRVDHPLAARALELLNVSYNRLTSLNGVRHNSKLKVLYARSNRTPTSAPSNPRRAQVGRPRVQRALLAEALSPL